MKNKNLPYPEANNCISQEITFTQQKQNKITTTNLITAKRGVF